MTFIFRWKDVGEKTDPDCGSSATLARVAFSSPWAQLRSGSVDMRLKGVCEAIHQALAVFGGVPQGLPDHPIPCGGGAGSASACATPLSSKPWRQCQPRLPDALALPSRRIRRAQG